VLVIAEHPSFEHARRAWNLAVDQRPAAVALPESVADVVATLELAREFGQSVAPQTTGHNAAPLGSLENTILLKTERMRGIEIFPESRIARVEAGVLSLEVVEAAADHGLATLAGSSPDVGVVGYTLGGGLSWLGRKYGLAASNVEAIELVTADARFVRVDRDNEPDLFWALRGGGGSFGVVTALELRLFPIKEVHAGILWWPIERGAEVLDAWGELTNGHLPDEFTTVARYLRLPPLPDIPEPVRGKSFIVVEAVHLGEPALADRLLAPLRDLQPFNDTIGRMGMAELSRMHMDPEHPGPGVGDGAMLAQLPRQALGALVEVAGAASDSPLLSVELRHLGGELARPRPGNGALASIDAPYALFAVGITPTTDDEAIVASHVAALKRAMAPWTASTMYLNFAETSRDEGAMWDRRAYERLCRIKAGVDPEDVIRSNHPVPAVL
jgi:hypothetical protein